MARKKKSRFGPISMGGGITLMIIAYLIYLFSTIEYLLEVQPEIFGTGLALFVLGLIWAIFGIKAG